jgi:4-diphosphocytidyl-2-C-methyl-D-erythritol kinase
MISFPNAKINLGLNIVARRADGYHDIETVFYPVNITDVIEIVPSRSGETTLTCYGRKVDCPVEKNLVMKACRLMQQRYDVPPVDMYLYKHIPDGAGLGGGSSDASSVLVMLNAMFSLGLTDDVLVSMASTLGADCPFFIYNRPLMATGIGDVFSPVDVNLKGKYLLLVKPDVSVPTKEAYAHVTPHTPEVPIPDILRKPLSEWRDLLLNDFEPSVFEGYPELVKIKDAIYASDADYVSMSGSGSSIFGIFGSVIMAEKASAEFGGCAHYVIAL